MTIGESLNVVTTSIVAAPRMSVRGKRKAKRDELVRVRSELLRAAVAWRGVSVAALAKRIGEGQQTIDLLVRGVHNRTRRARRDKLAKALGVTSEWLGGEAPLPFVPFPDFDDLDGEAAMELLKPPGAPTRLPSDVPARQQLAANDFARACEQACRRDFGNADWLRRAVLRVLLLVVDARVWRDSLLEDRRHAAAEAATVQLCAAFGSMLEPWLKGEESLNLRALLTITKPFYQLAADDLEHELEKAQQGE